MITPKAFENIIKHFDEIDRIVSSRTIRKRPWLEVALTSLLCDLLDEQTQDDYNLNYTFKNLQADLNKEDGLFGISLSLETIEFNSTYERYISQSDIGLNLIYENNIEPQYSWSRPYLLQAKRLTPKRLRPIIYTEKSSFTSVDKDQQKRIELLNELLGSSYLKYLLFCPRPESIDEKTKIKLSYLRNKTLSNHIFDYTVGLEIHKEFLKSSDSLKAGIFITDVINANFNLGQVHSTILQLTFPFSWFIAMNYLDQYDFLHEGSIMEKGKHQEKTDSQKLVEGILSGDEEQIEKLIEKIEREKSDNFPEKIQILPQHKITLKFFVGEQINVTNQNIHIE